MRFEHHHYIHQCALEPDPRIELVLAMLRNLKSTQELIMETQAVVAQRIEALSAKHTELTAQVNKVGGEISKNLADLRAAIENQGNADPAVLAALAAAEATAATLGAAVQTVDDQNPDPAPPPPAEPPAEPPAQPE